MVTVSGAVWVPLSLLLRVTPAVAGRVRLLATGHLYYWAKQLQPTERIIGIDLLTCEIRIPMKCLLRNLGGLWYSLLPMELMFFI